MGDRRWTTSILVADDDPLVRGLTTTMLEASGYDVTCVGDGVAAVQAATGSSFGLVIMDCQMPRLDGFRAVQEIRRHQAAARVRPTPILGLSARAMPGDAEAALAIGMDAYLTKPFSGRSLREHVAGLTGHPAPSEG